MTDVKNEEWTVGEEGARAAKEGGEELCNRESDVIKDLQDHKFAWSQRKDREQGEADDETGGGSQIANGKYQQAVPSTYYTPC